MEKYNAIKQSNKIKNEFSEYIKSTFDIRDPIYNDLFQKELGKMEDSLYKGPYLHSVNPFESLYTIEEMVNKGILHKKFLKLGGISDKKYKLYKHQVKAIEKIESGRNVVITTGTGSGKTECFLYPIIDTIIKEIENGNNENGIRAIFLFPMNALVNDQMDRVRNLLKTYSEIKFGFFTGDTPEKNIKNAVKKGFDNSDIENKPDNELLSREEMRLNPPHILFTNYSMLEYLLIRPSDACMISKDSMKYWRFVVLDEAHTYKGSLGVEISTLLRRLVGIVEGKPQFILTSATLGKGKKDIKKIISFAQSLTSGIYDEEDIIFAERIPVPLVGKYVISAYDYIGLRKNIDDIDVFKSIFTKYLNYDNNLNVYQNLYELLYRDDNTIKLFSLTKNGESFYYVLNELIGLSDNENALVDLIELIFKAVSINGNKLFDIKYHMFIKAPDGAFITLGKNKKLSLLTTNKIDEKKAFKIGICQNCRTPFVMGIVENDYLCIDNEVDIDEEFIEEKNSKIGYYLIKDCLTKNEVELIENDKRYVKYLVCPTCGHIRQAKNKKAISCDCNIEDEVVLYLYKEKADEESDDMVFSNNIDNCPICNYHTNTGGVVLGFHIGKDRATSLIAQILYRSMLTPKMIDKSKSFGPFSQKVVYKNGVKQFIAFSDARQQAAFFNKFINSNDDRFLKKALIWNILQSEDNQHNPISYTSLISKLTDKVQSELHLEQEEALKYSQSAALWELLQVDGRNSAEGLGLFAFKLNLPKQYYEDGYIESVLKESGFSDVSARDFRELTYISFEIFKTTPAIIYSLQCSDYNELDDLLGYRKFINYIHCKLPEKISLPPQYEGKVHSFLPKNDDSSNKIVRYVMNVYGFDINKAKDLLHLIYSAALNFDLITTNNYDQIHSNKYSVHSYKKLHFYRCSKCGKLSIYNINNCCIEGDCDGTLEECDPDVLLENNYYRKEYMNRPLQRMVSREHTAQIKSKEAKKIQEDFKNKKINIISCSTTFEMGIDLDDLNTVFMRNIPPSPANYVQRAGRAGRRADSSPFILTFCSTSSHDYTYFSDPINMISGQVEPPYFSIDNDKIMIRHITACALSYYFRTSPESFESISGFLENNHIEKFFDYINTKPIELGNYIDKYLLVDNYLFDTYGEFRWVNELEKSSKDSLKNFKEGIEGIIETYKTAIEQLKINQPKFWGAEVQQYLDALNRLKYRNSVIQYLSRYSVIPRYGFPVDNVTLQVYDEMKRDFKDEYDLTRDLSIAISEYAPESEVIVDGKKYTSRYIYTPYPNASQSIAYYIKCPHCGGYNVSIVKETDPNQKCCYCNQKLNISGNSNRQFIRPTRGFVAAKKNKETRRMKPMRSYSNDIVYIGNGKNSVIEPLDINSVIKISEYKNEELLVLNENPFYYCKKCGFTVLDRKAFPMTIIRKKHHNHKGIPCDVINNELQLTSLGHTFRTDIIKMQFFGIPEMYEYSEALSTLYALLEGISIAFDIDRNDIGGMIKEVPLKPYEFILFDTVSGGAGHVKRLEEKNNVIEALRKARFKVSQDCCDGDTACYNCLKTYYNQKVHNVLSRNAALKTIDNILKSISNNELNYKVKNIAIKMKNNDLINSFKPSDYISDIDSISSVEELKIQLSSNVCEELEGYGIVLSNSNGHNVYADFYWEKNKVLLFSLDNLASYEIMDKNGKYDCYLLDSNFNASKFVKRILKEE